jgi:hypothetical protein
MSSSDDDFFLFDEEEVKIVEEEKEKKVSFFDLFNDICSHGDYIDNYFSVKKDMPKEYNAYMMNKAFANFADTILIANEVNKHYNIPDEMQWRFYKNTVTKKKRFSKWFKALDEKEPIELLAKMFNCSVKEMRKNIHVIPKEKMDEIIQTLRVEEQ